MTEWHLVTGEYPPQRGGVSDYTFRVAGGLAARGDAVHVWCPPAHSSTPDVPGVIVHRELGRMSPGDLRRVDLRLEAFRPPRRLLVQWVPHAFGYRAMNVPFAAWLRRRAHRHGDRLGVMVHEAHVEFGRSLKEDVIATANRVMDVLLLSAAERVWVSTPEWGRALAPFSLGRPLGFDWLPVPSNVPVVEGADAAGEARRRLGGEGRLLVGHFGTYGTPIAPLLDDLIPRVARGTEGAVFVLLGRGAARYREALAAKHPELSSRLVAPRPESDADLSAAITACDLFVQPYPEGLTARRTSAMAVMAHARPMVSNAGRYTEAAWRDRGAAELVPLARGGAELADAAVRLAADPGRREALSAAAARLYAERFELRHTIEALRAWAAEAGPVEVAGVAGALG